MCEQCVKEEYPDRGTVCLDSGAYLANLAGCQGCGRKDTLKVANKTVGPSEANEEVTEFEHVCGECQHVVARHLHVFWVEDGYQNYTMSCMLCGGAEDTRSCLPDDPRFEAALF
ncbi:protein Churchill-like [Eriocheir sinensis]|uniref:protein Churchill-like n=1 Tax=Eriocheir sinensis TaxID=95602 RepID=UPI0021CADEB4|nr:protein Churchill-like [Eriocheir sinensis]XP_050705271.1 protein Churchill-like [Eriocheir sinensis]XP_050713555.1 protein Churchill-like [Eriocheir sinensis]